MSSLLRKWKYTAPLVIPTSSAMSEIDVAGKPLSLNSRDAATMISDLVRAALSCCGRTSTGAHSSLNTCGVADFPVVICSLQRHRTPDRPRVRCWSIPSRRYILRPGKPPDEARRGDRSARISHLGDWHLATESVHYGPPRPYSA